MTRWRIILLITLTFSITTAIKADWEEQRRQLDGEGWGLLAGISYTSVYEKNINQKKRIDSYDDDSSEQTGLVLPDLHLSYVGSSWSGFINFEEFNVTMESGIGTFSLTYDIHAVFEDDGSSGSRNPEHATGGVYENPFLLNQDRESTSIFTGGGNIEYSIGEDLVFSLSYTESWFEYEQDLTKTAYTDLGRSRKRQDTEVGLSMHVLSVSYGSTKIDAEGKADSADGTIIEADLLIPLESIGFYTGLTWSGETLKYRKTHPVFNKQREDTGDSYTWYAAKELGESWNIFLMVIQSETKSNIDFFNNKNQFITAGLEVIF